MNDRSPVRPLFLRDAEPCDIHNPTADHLDQAMIETARAAQPLDPSGSGPVFGYVVSYLAWHWRLAVNNGASRCPPDQALLNSVEPWLDAAAWPRANSARNDLRLAERLPANAVRARGLAHIAFLAFSPPQDIKFYDSRPLAMQLLADQGRYAAPWRNAAFGRMEADSAIGTGAAQVAVVSNPEASLPRVAKLLAEKLARAKRVRASSDGADVQVLAGRDANRLIELGYALARGGAAAQPYARPVQAMLDQRIARAAPPFGLFATPPTEFCRIARAIGGAAAADANRRDFCMPGFKGGDGVPNDG